MNDHSSPLQFKCLTSSILISVSHFGTCLSYFDMSSLLQLDTRQTMRQVITDNTMVTLIPRNTCNVLVVSSETRESPK